MNRLLLLLCVLLVSCSYESGRDESSRYYSVKQGSRLVLHRALTIPPNQVAVYLQYGQVKLQPDLAIYDPNCKFELYRISEQARSVEPDTFTVYRIVDERNEVSVGRRTWAALDNAFKLLSSDGPLFYNYATVMYLESAKQPDVFRITCQHWEDVFFDKYLSIEQMREAMGGVFSLEPAKP